MGSVGDAYDNSAAESFIATVKAELLHRHSWPTRFDAELAIFDFVEAFYNRKRRHSTIGQVSPEVFEQRYRSKGSCQLTGTCPRERVGSRPRPL
jgi:putative transposase